MLVADVAGVVSRGVVAAVVGIGVIVADVVDGWVAGTDSNATGSLVARWDAAGTGRMTETQTANAPAPRTTAMPGRTRRRHPRTGLDGPGTARPPRGFALRSSIAFERNSPGQAGTGERFRDGRRAAKRPESSRAASRRAESR